MSNSVLPAERIFKSKVAIHGAQYANGPHDCVDGSIHITDGRIDRFLKFTRSSLAAEPDCMEIDLSEFLIIPGLINAHDHLDFSLFPRLADPPHRNYIDWGESIHRRFPDVIKKYRGIRKDLRLWWGGIRNLLCGVTTVGHHNPLWPELQRSDFPVKVVQQYGWAHSLALGGDLRAAHTSTHKGRPFIVHACEGVDELARGELRRLDQLGLLDTTTVLVHGLAIDAAGLQVVRDRGVSLIVCPSSNNFLFGETPNMDLLDGLANVALGSDSPLTAAGDLLDEVQFAIHSCGVAPCAAYRMVTTAPASILRLGGGEGAIRVSGVGDLVAIRNTGQGVADRLRTLSMMDVELVMVDGAVQLCSESILARLPFPVSQGLEPLWIDGIIRWLRAPVKKLLRQVEEELGAGEMRLGSRHVRIPGANEST